VPWLSLQLNKPIALKLSAINSTRLLGSIMVDLQQTARRLRDLLVSILAAPTAAAALAAAAGDAAAAATAAAGGGGEVTTGGLAKHGSSAAAAAAGEGAKGVTAAAAAVGDAVRTEVELLQMLLEPLEEQVRLRWGCIRIFSTAFQDLLGSESTMGTTAQTVKQ
jgi:hypothetical protein